MSAYFFVGSETAGYVRDERYFSVGIFSLAKEKTYPVNEAANTACTDGYRFVFCFNVETVAAANDAVLNEDDARLFRRL